MVLIYCVVLIMHGNLCNYIIINCKESFSVCSMEVKLYVMRLIQYASDRPSLQPASLNPVFTEVEPFLCYWITG